MRLFKFRKLGGADVAEKSKLRLRILEIVNNKRLFCQKWCNFEDPYEGAYISFKGVSSEELNDLGELKLKDEKAYYSEVERHKLIQRSWDTRSRVCSLTLGPLSNQHMWEAYADGGAGVAIEFAVRTYATRIPLKKVKYAKGERVRGVRNVFGVLVDANGNINEFSDHLLDFKVQEYSNENEVRLICKQSELEPPPFCGDQNDKLALCEYRCEMFESGENCYYDFSHIMDIVKVWCGKNISDDDYIFLKNYIVPNVPVVKYDGESK